MGKSHAFVDSPIRGVGSKWSMATVINGTHRRETACIMVEFSDGWCICDMGDDNPMQVIKIEDLRLWKSVEKVSNIKFPKDWEHPDWHNINRVHDWKNHVSNIVASMWDTFTDDQKKAISADAEEKAMRERNGSDRGSN